jgi:3-oxoacyl-(acyl-carrier-protein) synthase III
MFIASATTERVVRGPKTARIEWLDRGPRITNTGSAMGDYYESNDEHCQRLYARNPAIRPEKVNPQWINARTGIEGRRLLAPGQTLSDLAFTAADITKGKDVEAEEIGHIFLASYTTRRNIPPTAEWLAAKLGATYARGTDINANCAGAVRAMYQAHVEIITGLAACTLAIGADAASRAADPTNPTQSPLFGDGSGGVRVQLVEGPGKLVITSLADTTKLSALQQEEEDDEYPHWDGKVVAETAKVLIPAVVEQTIAELGARREDIFIAPHQANRRMLEEIGGILSLRDDQIAINIDRIGNTGSAAAFLAFHAAREANKLERFSHIIFIGYGSGIQADALGVENPFQQG